MPRGSHVPWIWLPSCRYPWLGYKALPPPPLNNFKNAFKSVQFSSSVVFDFVQPHGLQMSGSLYINSPGVYQTYVRGVRMPSNHLYLLVEWIIFIQKIPFRSQLRTDQRKESFDRRVVFRLLFLSFIHLQYWMLVKLRTILCTMIMTCTKQLCSLKDTRELMQSPTKHQNMLMLFDHSHSTECTVFTW